MLQCNAVLSCQSKAIFRNSLCRCCSFGSSVVANRCSANQTTIVSALGVFQQGKGFFHIFLESLDAITALPASSSAEISSMRHRPYTEIAPGARGLSETRPSKRDILSLQRPSARRNRICRSDKRGSANQAEGTYVCVPIPIKKSPANVRFSDLGWGLNYEYSRSREVVKEEAIATYTTPDVLPVTHRVWYW